MTSLMPHGFLMSVLSLLAQRYYELSTSKEHPIREEYLLVKVVTLLAVLYTATRAKDNNIKKDLVVIMMSAEVSQRKKVFDDNADKYTDLRSALLYFDLLLLTDIVSRNDFKIE